jgi:hypothetical protein
MTGQHINTQPAPHSSYVADLSPSIEAAVLKAMAKDPSDRHHDISAFLAAIDADVSPPEPAFPFHSYAKTLSGPPWP